MFVARFRLLVLGLILVAVADSHAQLIDGSYPTIGLPFEVMRTQGDPNDTMLPFGNKDLSYNMTARKNFRGDIICRGGYLAPEIRVYRRSLDRGYLPTPGLRSKIRIEADLSVTEIQIETSTEYHYDSLGRLEKIQAPNGRYISLSRDASGRATQIYDGSGRSITLIYNGNLVVSATFSAGGAIEYQYVLTSVGNKISQVTNLAGDISTFTYDDLGRTTSQFDPFIGKIEVSKVGSSITAKDSDGVIVVDYRIDSGTRTSTSENSLGLRTELQRDFRGLVLFETTSRGRISNFDYDADQNLIRSITNSDTVKMRYDSFGGITHRVRALGETLIWTYDTFQRVTEILHPTGASETFAYDTTGNVTFHKLQNGSFVRHEYDAAGNRIKSVDPDGIESLFEYDARGFVTVRKTCDCVGSSGFRTTFTYDSAGYLASRSNGVETTSISLDTIGRPLVTVFPGGAQRVAKWHAAGPISFSNSVSGETIAFSYGAMGVLTSTLDATGAKYEFANSQGRIIQSKSGLGDITRYQFDSAANLAGVTWPTNSLGTPQRTFFFDSENRQIKRIRETGDIIEYSYDSSSRLIARKVNGSIVATFSYDSQGLIRSTSDALGEMIYTVNSLGQPTRIQYQNGSIIDWEYSPAGRITRIASGSYSSDIAYDSYGQLKTQSTEAGNITFTYDAAAGRISCISYPNGVVAAYTYGPTGFPSRMEYRNIGSETIVFDIVRDSAGRILSAYRSDLDETLTVSYTVRGEIASGDIRRATDTLAHRFTYDSAGNRIKYQTSAGDTEYLYDPGNLLDTGGMDYSYNLVGEVTSIGPRSISYDAEGRVRTDSTVQDLITYDYDAFGRRARAASSGGYKWRIWGDRNEIADADGSGNITEFRYYIPGMMDRLLGFSRGSQTYFTLLDPAGNVVLVLDESGGIKARYAFDPFQLRNDATFDSIDNRFRFAARREEQSGEVYVRARSFDQGTGRFMQRDPLFIGNSVDPFSWHGFIYANSDGINRKDPSGEACIPGPPQLYDMSTDYLGAEEIGWRCEPQFIIYTYLDKYIVYKVWVTEFTSDDHPPEDCPPEPELEIIPFEETREVPVDRWTGSRGPNPNGTTNNAASDESMPGQEGRGPIEPDRTGTCDG